MEMESSRRPPFDRSRDLVKKPRLTDDLNLSGRQFQAPAQPQRPVNPPVSGLTRFRTGDREREPEDPIRGALNQYQQHQELVNQYRTALAELTFNSKPIITNLTIIAGENVQAAKAIASTICSNILEVPSEQKLPSLYLLDSIVKNIGRDYIKYFAPRLPEVFCKAYRQVDPSIHSGMRHLFGTWKGVFPPQSLQVIEKDLGFHAPVNGPSPVSAASKPDSQSQRQPHGIHVNPKYLEARQRLQQSNKSKGAEIGSSAELPEDVERPERTATAGTGRPWASLSPKMQNIQRSQRETLREPSQQKQGVAGYGDHKFASGVSRPLSTPVGKPSDRLIGQDYDKRWLGTGREVESLPSARNGHDVKCGISSLPPSRSASGNVLSMQNPQRSGEMSRSWKNSEEEEYMWDDLGTSMTDSAAIPGSKRDAWPSDDLDKLDYNPQEVGRHHPKWPSQSDIGSSLEREPSADALSYEEKEQGGFGFPRSTPWNAQGPCQIDSSSPLLQHVGANPMTGISSTGFSNALSGSARSIGKHHVSSVESLMHQRPPSPTLSKRDPRQSLVAKDHLRTPLSACDPRIASFTGHHNQITQDTLPGKHQTLQSDSQEQSNVSSLLAAVMKSGLLPGGSASGEPVVEPPAPSLLASRPAFINSGGAVTSSGLSHDPVATPFAQRTVEKLPLSVSSPSLPVASSKPETSSGLSHDPVATPFAQRMVEKLPLSVSSPSLPVASSKPAQTSDVANANSNPLSSLISTLMAKGLISASKTESIPPIPPVQSKSQTPEESPMVVTAAPVVVPSVPKTSSIPKAISAPKATVASEISSIPKTSPAPQAPDTKKLSASEATGKISDASACSAKVEIENLIGFQFRPPLLRELHPVVIDRLLVDLPHRCAACGIQFTLQESLDRHSLWHAFRNSIPNNLNRPSRRWYSNSVDWIAGKTGFPFGYKSGLKENEKTGDEKMVPADESHCVCLLCGELFEDIYSQERGEWMFKGAVYLSIPSGSNERGSFSESGGQNLIVHANCMSDDSVHDLGLIHDVKVEKDA